MSKKRFIPVSLFSVILNKYVPIENRWNTGNLFTRQKTFEDRQVGLELILGSDKWLPVFGKHCFFVVLIILLRLF